ncbi:CDK5 regulatory subunit-associated protein 2 [Armadillidium nasatum]|uniref:CDK5 regulatory subunit-associated protein 2 n=1 Tax=Armadillidium nasatum TaxID=96803 RepID=A0A5N5SR08_9CRUS|nr:CDK5 regulatory subunit-associated protein 2 [Armadillidium nasatum]
MCRTCGRRHNSYEMDPSSSGPQDSSPLRGRNIKDTEEQNEHLKKENFSLKLRIYFLEEKMNHKGIKEDKEELHKANIELKVETEALKKQLCDKQELLRQAAGLVTNMENQFKEQLQATQENHEQELKHLGETIEALKKDLEEHSQKAQQEWGGDLTQLCGLAFNNLAEYPDKNMTDLNRPHKNNPLMSSNRLQGIFSIQDPVESEIEERSRHSIKSSLKEDPEIVPESALNKIKELEDEVERLAKKIKDLQETLDEKERTSMALEEDIVNLKKEIEDREEKLSDLEFEVTEKDQKVDQLMQELETRHQEIKVKNTTIQTLHEDLNKKEKTEQLQQQNKILVEIQITLDEKQKQISELEESLTTTRQKMEKLNHDYDFSLRTIKEMVTQLKTRDKEIGQLKKEVKRKEKKESRFDCRIKRSFRYAEEGQVGGRDMW